MHRIDVATAVAVLPAPTADGPNPGGFWSNGNAQTGTPGTLIDSEWMNMIQEEIAHVVEDADGGNTPLDKSLRTQLKNAIKALIAAAAAVPTGTVVATIGSAADAGYLLLDGATVGSSGSAATHADDGYEALFLKLWNSMADGQAPVSGGRGASAAADWGAGKTITLPDLRGRTVIGSGQGAGLTQRTHGAGVGAETHQLTEAELPAHDHDFKYQTITTYTSGGVAAANQIPGNEADTVQTETAGGDAAHNNMQPSLALNWQVKV